MKVIIEAIKRGQYAPIIGGAVVGAAIGWVVAEVLVYQLFDKKNKVEYIDVEVPIEYDKGTENAAPVILTKEERQKAVIKVNYAEKFKEGKLPSIPPKDETMTDEYDGDVEGDLFDQGPFVITEEEYAMQEEANKYHFLYYEEDDVLTDDKDRIVPDYEDNIGLEALTSFGDSSDDPDVVCIQNDDENAVYEIIRIHGSYYEDVVLGKASKSAAKKTSKPKKKKIVPPLEDEDEDEE